MSKAPERKPEIINAESLNKYILGCIAGIRTKEVSHEDAEAISKLSDKAIKLNLTRLMYKKEQKNDLPIDFFESAEKNMLIAK